MEEEDIFYLLEFKTTHELFAQRFVYNVYDFRDKRDGFDVTSHLFINTESTEELSLPIKFLEYHKTRLLREDELNNYNK